MLMVSLVVTFGTRAVWDLHSSYRKLLSKSQVFILHWLPPECVVPFLYPCSHAQPSKPAGAAADPLAALTTALNSLMPNQPSTNLKTPTFEWTTSDQYHEFKLLCRSTERWFHLQAIPDKPNDKGAHLEYTLNFLGTTGHQKWNQWTPAGVTTDDIAATKKSTKSFLDHVASQMDHTVSHWCWIYQLDDMWIKSGGTPDELADCLRAPHWSRQLSNWWGKGMKHPIPSRLCPHRQWAGQEITHSWPQDHNSQGAQNMQDSHTHNRQLQCYGLWACHCCQQMELMTSVSPTTTATKMLTPQNQHAWRNYPAKDSTCWSCGKIGHWSVRCQSTSSKQKDLSKKPPRHRPKGGKQKQTYTVDVGDDYNLQCDEDNVITIDVHPHHSAKLCWKPEMTMPGPVHCCLDIIFQLHKVLSDCIYYTHVPRVSPTIIYYHIVAYITWMEIVQIICDHRIITPVVLQYVINAMKMNDIFSYCLSYFGHNQLNGQYILGHNVQQYFI